MRKRKRTWNLKFIIISALRKIFFYSPLRKEALERAKSGSLYKSAGNRKRYPINEVTVDHIDPVVDPAKGFENWDTFISRLFCPVENLQVLSKKEHNAKTQKERKERKNRS